jgi:hypothetical protein
LIPKGISSTEEADVESLRRYLEDQITLLDLADDPEVVDRPTDVASEAVQYDDYNDYDYDDDDDEDLEESAFQ